MIRSKIKKINPARSNKMIFAVAAGLAIVLIIFFTLAITGGGKGGSRGGSMARALDYLKNTEGLVTVKTMDDARRAVIVYNSDSKNAGNFEKVAHFAALRLAPHWHDCEVQLAKNTADQIVYAIQVKNGSIVSEGPLPAGSDRP
jgi:hypothetical protein